MRVSIQVFLDRVVIRDFVFFLLGYVENAIQFSIYIQANNQTSNKRAYIWRRRKRRFIKFTIILLDSTFIKRFCACANDKLYNYVSDDSEI